MDCTTDWKMSKRKLQFIFIFFVVCGKFLFSEEYELILCPNFFCDKMLLQPKLKDFCLFTGPCECWYLLQINNSQCWDLSSNFLLHDTQHNESTKGGLVLTELVAGYVDMNPQQLENALDKLAAFISIANLRKFKLFKYTIGFQCSSNTLSLKLPDSFQRYNIEEVEMANSCISKIEQNISLFFPNLVELKLKMNLLTKIYVGMFSDLNQLEILDLSRNDIYYLENGLVFNGLSSLMFLDLSHNHFSLSFIPHMLDALKNLRFLFMNVTPNLSFSRFMNGTIKTGTFEKLARLEYLSLEDQGLRILPSEAFHLNTFGRLRYLNLKTNAFTNLSTVLEKKGNIITLDMSYNMLLGDNDILLGRNSSSIHGRITNFLCNNCYMRKSAAEEAAQHVLEYADFNGNYIDRIDMNLLSNIAHLKRIHLGMFNYNHCVLNVNHTYPLYVNLSSKLSDTQIQMSQYHFERCEFISFLMVHLKRIMPLDFGLHRSNISFILSSFKVGGWEYESVENFVKDVRISDVVCNFTFFCPEKCMCTTKGLNETITINCNDKELFTFPNVKNYRNPIILHLHNNHISRVSSKFLQHHAIFVELHFSNNRLESLEHLEFTQHLQVLDLQNNRLKHLSSLQQLLSLTSPLIRLMLSGNPWICGCDISGAKNFFLARQLVDFQDIKCTSVLDHRRILYFSDVTENEVCPSENPQNILWYIIFPVVSFVLVVTIAGIIIWYRRKAYLKFWLFTHGLCLPFVTEDDNDADKPYDAFISYSSLDIEWVGRHLVPGLENQAPFYKLCLHDRDWRVGQWISDQIILSVSQSRRTIIVLTENFVNSNWSRMEFMAAYRQSVADHVNRVLIVVLGQLPEADKLGEELRAFISHNTFVEWDDPYFWRKLRSAMPRVNRRERRNRQEETAI